MRSIHLLLILTLVSLGVISEGHGAENSPERRKARGAALAELAKQHQGWVKAALKQEKAHQNFVAGRASVKDVINASLAQLRFGLTIGPGTHAATYDNQVSKLIKAVQAKLIEGATSNKDLDMAKNARLDVILSNVILAPSWPPSENE